MIKTANDMLRHRYFDRCLQTCCTGISEAKNSENSKFNTDIESLCIIAIQAYAELDRWPEVLPFVTQLYNGIEDCPGEVVRLCILLHAYMKDFTTCSAIAHIWLRNPRNSSNLLYEDIVEVFLLKVLLPQRKWKEIKPFLEGCQSLTVEKHNLLLSNLKSNQKGQQQMEEHERANKTLCRMVNDDTVKFDGRETRLSSKVFKDISTWLVKLVPKTACNLLGKLMLLSFLLYLLMRNHFDLVYHSKAKNIFQSMLTLFKSIFTMPE